MKAIISLLRNTFRKILPILVLALVVSCAASKESRDLRQRLGSSPAFSSGFTGLAVYDPAKKQMIFQYNADKYFTPASNIKLLTYYAGLKILGDSLPGIRYGIRHDSLFFTGTADPSLLHPRLPASAVPAFLKRTENSLFYIPPVFPTPPLGPGWAWDDFDAAYSAERSALPVYGNLVHVQIQTGSPPVVEPEWFLDSLNRLPDTPSELTREWATNQFWYSGKDVTRKIPFKTSHGLSIELLEAYLDQPIEMLSSFSLPENTRTVYSIPADSLYRDMLISSDNFLAEQLLLLCAGELSDTLDARKAIRFMKETHLRDLPDEPVWVDGSGLSRYNLLTPRTTVKVLEKLAQEEGLPGLLTFFPAGGKTGTLKEDFKGNPPYLFAKTGSLSNQYSLSGFLLTEKNNILIFSFMNSNFTIPSSLLKAEMEKILEQFRQD